jgi:hypothetical protein
MCTQIKLALHDFHSNKQAIIDAKARRGKGNSLIDNWFIPKLEFMQSVVSNIRLNGAAVQWSVDITENAHIHVAKNPARSGNNQAQESQICCYLDRSDKVHQFDLAMAIRSAHIDFCALFESEDDSPLLNTFDNDDSDSEVYVTIISSSSTLLKNINPVSSFSATSCTIDYFNVALHLRHSSDTIPHPLRTQQCSKNTVFHLTRDPSYKKMMIDEAASKFNLPDFRAAIGDYMIRLAGQQGEPFIKMVGGHRHSSQGCTLPFTHVEVWNCVQLQSKSYHTLHDLLPAHTINAYPASSEWPLGRFDSVLVNNDPLKEWPLSGLAGNSLFIYMHYMYLTFLNLGHLVVDLRLIFRIISSMRPLESSISDCFLTYVQRFDFVPQAVPRSGTSASTSKALRPEASSSLHVLKRAKHMDSSIIGDVVPLHQLWALIDLVPHFHEAAPRSLTYKNSSNYSSEFFLNKYFVKESFWAFHNTGTE